MFKIVQKQTKARKDELKSLLTSLKFRGKRLRNNFLSDSKNNEIDLIVEVTETIVTNSEDTKAESDLTPSLLELREIVSDIFA